MIRREQIADFILFSVKSDSALEIQAVFVKGHPVWQNGKWVEAPVNGERWLP
ncbi:MAG: hypothetical protein GF353_00665 [Candidatus Lokiarchaeota archaeon]|nr:hypothetical protein [Candidatus Lokiarchaeota archaeon]